MNPRTERNQIKNPQILKLRQRTLLQYKKQQKMASDKAHKSNTDMISSVTTGEHKLNDNNFKRGIESIYQTIPMIADKFNEEL